MHWAAAMWSANKIFAYKYISCIYTHTLVKMGKTLLTQGLNITALHHETQHHEFHIKGLFNRFHKLSLFFKIYIFLFNQVIFKRRYMSFFRRLSWCMLILSHTSMNYVALFFALILLVFWLFVSICLKWTKMFCLFNIVWCFPDASYKEWQCFSICSSVPLLTGLESPLDISDVFIQAHLWNLQLFGASFTCSPSSALNSQSLCSFHSVTSCFHNPQWAMGIKTVGTALCETVFYKHGCSEIFVSCGTQKGLFILRRKCIYINALHGLRLLCSGSKINTLSAKCVLNPALFK